MTRGTLRFIQDDEELEVPVVLTKVKKVLESGDVFLGVEIALPADQSPRVQEMFDAGVQHEFIPEEPRSSAMKLRERDMSKDEILEGRESVERWFRSAFPDGILDVTESIRLGEFIFRIEEGGHWYELSISDEALEDIRGEFEGVLQRQDAATTLRENPNSRLPFVTETRRVLPREELRVRVGPRHYLVTRDTMLVRISDENGVLLANMPPDTRTHDSIHKGSQGRWPEQIEMWRGKNQ